MIDNIEILEKVANVVNLNDNLIINDVGYGNSYYFPTDTAEIGYLKRINILFEILQPMTTPNTPVGIVFNFNNSIMENGALEADINSKKSYNVSKLNSIRDLEIINTDPSLATLQLGLNVENV